MSKIAVFGGAFDPPHTGHVKLVQSVCELVEPAQTLIIPTGNAPHKTFTAPFKDRMEMAELAFSGLVNCDVLDIENADSRISYTVDTLRELHVLYPDSRFVLVVGGDSLADFHKWKDYKQILGLCTIAAGGRDGTSSTQIREMLRARSENGKVKAERIADIVPRSVLEYIEHKGLYL